MPTTFQLALALLVVLGYLAFCAAIRRSYRQHAAGRLAAAMGDPASRALAESPLVVAFATQTGFAEELAWQTARAMRSGNGATRVMPLAQLDLAMLSSTPRILFVVSTTGDGDVPDAAASFARHVMATAASLSALRFGMLALGDRSYAHFCGFGHRLDAWLRAQGATALFERVDVDNADPAALAHWYDRVGAVTGAALDADWAPARYGAWTLVDRRLLNPGSPGGPAYCIALRPSDATLAWSAGDIAEILPDTLADAATAAQSVSDQGGAPQRDAAPAPALRREYSIASIPADGVLELVVRQHRRDDGTMGLASGWLTERAPIGAEIALRIRTNRSFHLPADDRPLILIGNGTGIAGLRGLIKARARLAQHRNWLLFGERTAAHDRYFGEEIEHWSATGVLARIDFAFSRDATQPVYVQHRLLAAAADVRAWVATGAAIYVCGSREGMAAGVDDALRTALGSETLDALRDAGRYRRDIY